MAVQTCVTGFALLFDTTWVMNSLVFGGVLLAVLAAVEVTQPLAFGTNLLGSIVGDCLDTRRWFGHRALLVLTALLYMHSWSLSTGVRRQLTMGDMTDDDPTQIRHEFAHAVNMTARELTQWLDTDESTSVGQKSEPGGESTGHHYGRRVVELLNAKAGDLTDDDVADMKKVSSYVARHLAQRPDKSKAELENTPWRYSLMNWGHDPLK